jgi:hypothetical protein
MMPAHAGFSSDKEAEARIRADMLQVQARNQELVKAPDQRGCLGKDAVTCVATIGLYLQISSGRPGMPGEFSLPTSIKRDINGEPMVQSVNFLTLVTPIGRPKTETMAILTSLSLYDGVHVHDIDFTLVKNPRFARTPEEWDSSGVYQLAFAVLGPDCVGRDRLAFYRLFDKAMNSDLATKTNGNHGAARVDTDSGGADVPMCGQALMLPYWNVSTDARGTPSSSTGLNFRTMPASAK